MGRIRGTGRPGKIRPAGTLYEDSQTGILYIQNRSPQGNEWTSLDANSTDDSTGGSGTFSGGTIPNATNFLSTISSGGTNLNSIFSTISSVNAKASSVNTELSGIMSLIGSLTTQIFVTSDNYVVDRDRNDFIVISDSQAKSVTLPVNPTNGRLIVIINDGDMSGLTTTINPSGKLINGASFYDINNANSTVILCYSSTKSGWYVISEITSV